MKLNVPNVCVFHANCIDGSISAYLVWSKFRGHDIKFIPASYSEEPNISEFEAKDVMLVDFSYKNATLDAIAAVAKSVVIIDHHESFKREIQARTNDFKNLTIIYDEKECGSTLVYKTLYADGVPPHILKYVRDRDLWLKEFEETDAVHSYLTSLPEDFETFDEVFSYEFEDILIGGEAILRQRQMDIAKILDTAITIKIKGHAVPTLFVPKCFVSEALNQLAVGQPFAANFRIEKGSLVADLRSVRAGIEVNLIAEKFGGGGHKNAAGFTLPLHALYSLHDHLL